MGFLELKIADLLADKLRAKQGARVLPVLAVVGKLATELVSMPGCYYNCQYFNKLLTIPSPNRGLKFLVRFTPMPNSLNCNAKTA